MHCTKFDKCEFIEMIDDAMPNTASFARTAYCADKGRCLKKELARTMIEHLLEGKFTIEK